MKQRKSYLDVDWVELGCRGWEIDNTGAMLCDYDEWNHCHLDRKTLDIMGAGDGQWWERVIRDLRVAGVPGLVGFVSYGTYTTGSSAPSVTVNWGGAA